MLRNVLADAIPADALAEHALMAAALQVHFARLAATLDASRLKSVGNGACPACGGPLVASLVVGWQGAHGTRFCACALCGTLWNYVRIKCTLCGSTEGIAYHGSRRRCRNRESRECDCVGATSRSCISIRTRRSIRSPMMWRRLASICSRDAGSPAARSTRSCSGIEMPGLAETAGLREFAFGR